VRKHRFSLKLLAQSKDNETYLGATFQVEISSFYMFFKYLLIGRIPSKTFIIPEGRPMGSCPFRPFLVSSDPNDGQKTTSKAFNHWGYFPGHFFLIFIFNDNRFYKRKKSRHYKDNILAPETQSICLFSLVSIALILLYLISTLFQLD